MGGYVVKVHSALNVVAAVDSFEVLLLDDQELGRGFETEISAASVASALGGESLVFVTRPPGKLILSKFPPPFPLQGNSHCRCHRT